MKFTGIDDDAARKLEKSGYIALRQIATVVFLASATGKPILVEGPAGSGKTELARAAADSLGREKIRLQCYEGLDEAKALSDTLNVICKHRADACLVGNSMDRIIPES